ncbi:unnamed protein product [Vicia faba]|uniref:Uncharacterized protein n=1 Tax=Vicia faba TaxID=3906 RepID=A0AAV0Z2Y4_VICFA|nr:unnamed protein product [Vicia faba]
MSWILKNSNMINTIMQYRLPTLMVLQLENGQHVYLDDCVHICQGLREEFQKFGEVIHAGVVIDRVLKALKEWMASGREFVTRLVGSAVPNSKISRRKIMCLTDANIVHRIHYDIIGLKI